MANTIRMTDFAGDFDSLHAVNLAGPFDTPAARDAELYRVSALVAASAELRGLYDFEASALDVVGADSVASPAALAAAGTAEDVVEAFR